MLVRPPQNQFQDDCQTSLCCFYKYPLPLSLKALAHWLLGILGWGSQPLDRCLPSSQLPVSKIKQTFLSTNLASLLAVEWRAARPPLLVTGGR